MLRLIGPAVCLLLIVACGPSPERIASQTAVAATSTAAAWTSTPTRTLTPTSTATPTPHFTGLGATRVEIQARFEDLGLEFEPPTVEDGYERVFGHYVRSEPSEEIAVFVVLMGPENDLLEATISVGVPVIPPQDADENIVHYLKTFVEIVAPDWVDGGAWIDETLPVLSRQATIATQVDELFVRIDFEVLNEPDVRAINHLLTIGSDATRLSPVDLNKPPPLSTPEPGWVQRRGLGVSFAYPGDWFLGDVSKNPYCYDTIDCLLDINSPEQDVIISVVRTVFEQTRSTEELDQRFWAVREEAFNRIDPDQRLVLVSKDEIQVDGRTAIQRVFNEPNVFGGNPEQMLYVVNVLFVDDPYTYTLLLSANSENARAVNMEVLRTIIRSMQIAPRSE